MRVLPQGISDIWNTIPAFRKLLTQEFHLLSRVSTSGARLPIPKFVCQSILGADNSAVLDACPARCGDTIVQLNPGTPFFRFVS